MYPHRIRLRGPWECEPIGIDAPAARRVTMPARWAETGLAGYRGLARFIRNFGYPGKADPELEHIWLTCDGCSGCREVRLNGTLLVQSPGETFAVDATSFMSARNQLEVVIQGDTDDAGLWGEVALEMRKDAYLAEVTVQRYSTSLVVNGKVVGMAPSPLELYTLVDRHHVDYRTIQPTEQGTPFHIELTDISPGTKTVRIELIHISAIWYVVELPVSQWKTA